MWAIQIESKCNTIFKIDKVEDVLCGTNKGLSYLKDETSDKT